MKTKAEVMTKAELSALFDDMRWRLVFVSATLNQPHLIDAMKAQLEVVKDCLYELNCIAEEATTQN